MSTNRLQQLLSFLEKTPKDSFLLFAIAKEFEGSGRLDEALNYYLKLLRLDSDYVGTYYHLGKLYERMEDYEKAFSTYKDGIEIAKKIGDRHAHGELAEAKLILGEDEDFE